jgi:hypothetical protein
MVGSRIRLQDTAGENGGSALHPRGARRGLPFVVANISGNFPGFTFANYSGLDTTGAESTIVASGAPNSAAIFFRRAADNAASSALAANSSNSTGAISGSMVYQA